jgi:hypothetical protein
MSNPHGLGAMRLCTVGLLLAAALAAPATASTQAVRGRLLDASTGTSILGGLVLLVDTAGNEMDRAISGNSGEFFVRARQPGSFKLRAERLGYRATSSGRMTLAVNMVRYVEFRLGVEAVELEPLRVVAEPRVRQLEQAGFYARRESGIGLFYTRDDFDLRRPLVATDILRGAPGVRVIPVGRGNTIRFSRNDGASFRRCGIRIWVDGMFLGDENSFDFLHPDDIEAVEVFRGAAGLPAQYAGSESACGAILVWTRRGTTRL